MSRVSAGSPRDPPLAQARGPENEVAEGFLAVDELLFDEEPVPGRFRPFELSGELPGHVHGPVQGIEKPPGVQDDLFPLLEIADLPAPRHGLDPPELFQGRMPGHRRTGSRGALRAGRLRPAWPPG